MACGYRSAKSVLPTMLARYGALLLLAPHPSFAPLAKNLDFPRLLPTTIKNLMLRILYPTVAP